MSGGISLPVFPREIISQSVDNCEMRFIYFGRLILSFFFSESFCYKFEILQKNARLSKAVYGILKCVFVFFYYQCTILISRSQQYRVNQ